jgi:predicted RNase H-like nuclease (RuvC/YqgF family)
MSEKQWVIVGLDPGTTIGYAILDLEGKLLKVDSSKEFNLSKVIEKVIEFGKVIAVGTDKQRVPSLVSDFAAKTGAKIISPDEDLSVKIKNDLTQELDFKGDHQQDAIASAILAYKNMIPTINKIIDILKKNKKEHLKNKVIGLVIKNEGISIRSAIEIIEKPTETNKIIKKVIEEKELKDSDFFKLNEKIKFLEDENRLLKLQTEKLKQDINRNSKPAIREVTIIKDDKLKGLIKQKDSQLTFLYDNLGKKNNAIKLLNEEIKRITGFILKINQNVLVKKIDNLGSAEFEKKKTELSIQKDDILLVNNPNIISENVYQAIKNKINIIIFREAPSKKIREEFNFVYIDSKKLRIEEDKNFAVISKDDFEKAIQTNDILKRVIREYQSGQT